MPTELPDDFHRGLAGFLRVIRKCVDFTCLFSSAAAIDQDYDGLWIGLF